MVHLDEQSGRAFSHRAWKRHLKQIHDYCCYCGAPDPSTLDHYVPRYLGGSSHPDNLVLCCWQCNQEKSHSQPGEWLSLLVERGSSVTWWMLPERVA